MNRKEAFEIKEKYGDDAWHIALEILEKDRTISYWNGKLNEADYYIGQNHKKIEKLEAKLEKVKGAKK